MAEGEWRVRVCGGDRGACGCCGCDCGGGGAVGNEDAQEGCGRSEGEGWEGLVCLLGNKGLRSARYGKSDSRFGE